MKAPTEATKTHFRVRQKATLRRVRVLRERVSGGLRPDGRMKDLGARLPFQRRLSRIDLKAAEEARIASGRAVRRSGGIHGRAWTHTMRRCALCHRVAPGPRRRKRARQSPGAEEDEAGAAFKW